LAAISEDAPRRALDVGCGDGRFLAQLAAQGWTVEGLETDSVAAELARKRTGGTIHEAPLEEVTLPRKAFGLVSILHVLEHVPDPRETLTAAWNALAPGGALLIAVPNVNCLEARLFRSCWYPLDLPRHYWGFAPRTLTRLAEECGFAVQRIRHFPFLFGPQSIRYSFKAISGKPIGEEEGSAGPRREGGKLRTQAFLSLLTASERLGHEMPGEVMELLAVRQ
ncbi:class I SAM-dependent methyltransferase, partial [Armatimonas sp.]|uniref:class I SAM-dependent methyltransferase n=1 Tax=Armatimonas sp. TaxID=1872638 RepID=UPI00375392B3